jgi:hypothetical protein
MSKVGPKVFAYGKKGEKEAAAYARKTGQKLTVTKAKKKG